MQNGNTINIVSQNYNTRYDRIYMQNLSSLLWMGSAHDISALCKKEPFGQIALQSVRLRICYNIAEQYTNTKYANSRQNSFHMTIDPTENF